MPYFTDKKNLEKICLKDNDPLFRLVLSDHDTFVCALSRTNHPTEAIQYYNCHKCPYLSPELAKDYKKGEAVYACKCKYSISKSDV